MTESEPSSPKLDLVALLRHSWHYLALVAIAIWLLYRVRAILSPFVVALVLAYILDPFLDRLEAKGWSRDRAVWFVFAIAGLVFLVFVAVFVPILWVQAGSLASTVRETVARMDALIGTMPGVAAAQEEGSHAGAEAGESESVESPVAPEREETDGESLSSESASPPESAPEKTRTERGPPAASGESQVREASGESAAEESAESGESETSESAEFGPSKAESAESGESEASEGAESASDGAAEKRLRREWDRWYAEHLPGWTPEWAVGMLPAPDLSDPATGLAEYRAQLTRWGQQLATSIGGFLLASLSGLFKYIFTPFLAYYFMREFDPMRERVWSWIPRRYHRHVHTIMDEGNRMLASYFRGQLLLMFLVFCSCLLASYLVKLWLGIDNVLLVAAVDGLFYAIPIAGAWIASAVAVVVGYVTADGNPWIGALVMFAVVQLVNLVFDQVIQPKIAGQKVGLHPLVVIFAVLAGATMMGFVGMLVAVPVAAGIKIIIRTFMPEVLRDLGAAGAGGDASAADGPG